MAKSPEIVASEPNKHGYRAFTFDEWKFSRDEYFVHIEWPKGKHTMEVDRFLRAMNRDIGWGFFYGWIFFDDVFGTTNHYGTVDIFAGAYDQGCKAAKIDFLRTYTAEAVSKAFEDWPGAIEQALSGQQPSPDVRASLLRLSRGVGY